MRLLLLPLAMLLCAALSAQQSARSAVRAELAISAFRQGYPDKITDSGYDKEAGDWYLVADGRKFFWAEGRLLPEEFRHEPEKWRPYIDYMYPRDIPDPGSFTEEDVQRISRAARPSAREARPPYNLEFHDALYDGKTRAALESHIKSVSFLGKTASVHEDIAPRLVAVEQEIYAAAKGSQEVRQFVDTLLRAEGYNWREIADSQSRSYHSWGLAVDLLPVGWGQKNLYWSWISQWNDRWMELPLSRRWMPPEAVVDIFESHGFIWGGKWLMWDNMHFEYRPELILLREWTEASS